MSDVWSELSRLTPADRAAWRREVDKALRGRNFDDALVRKTIEGLTLSPLYTREDLPPGAETERPGAAPFTRGFPAPHDPAQPRRGWLRGVEIAPSDIDTANAMILADLEGGASRVVVHAAALARVEDLARVLNNVHWSMAPVSVIAAGGDVALARALFAHCAALRARGGHGLGAQIDVTAEVAASSSSGLAPVAEGRPQAIAIIQDDIVAEVTRASAAAVPFADARPLLVSTTRLREAGADLVQEVAAAIGVFVDLVRALDGRVTPAQVLRACEFRVGVGNDFFGEIAKLRAFRRALALVLDSLGIAHRAGDVFVTASTAEETAASRDVYVNLLRTTAQASAAVFGGADAVIVLPFDARLGGDSLHSRRLARNLQSLLDEESAAGAVTDPAGGSFYVEARTEQIAEAAWQQFVRWEADGGFFAVGANGAIASALDAQWQARAKRLRTRRDPVLGVSVFPNLDEAPLGTAAAAPGATLPRHHYGEDFERLRARIDRVAASTGARPSVTAVLIGAPLSYAARFDWVRDLVATAGIALREHRVDEDAAASAAASGPALIVAADALHGTAVIAAASALRAAGATRIVVAGRAGDHAQAHRSAGVTDHIFAGADAITFLSALVADLEAPHAAS